MNYDTYNGRQVMNAIEEAAHRELRWSGSDGWTTEVRPHRLEVYVTLPNGATYTITKTMTGYYNGHPAIYLHAGDVIGGEEDGHGE